MKKYALKFFVFCLVLLLPFAGAFSFLQALPAQFGGTIMGTLPHKIELAQETPGPRILLAGGSSSPYATNCALIVAETGLPCINVGVTAYLGLGYYLRLLESTMRPGDIIVLGPEHSMLSGKIDYLTVWMAIENHRDAWAFVPPGYWPKMATAYGNYAGEKCRQARATEGETLPSYDADFGPLGDVTLYREPLLEDGYNRDDPISLTADTLTDSVSEELSRFARKTADAGVSLYFAWAPVNRLALVTPPQEAPALQAAIESQTGIPTLGQIEDAILPPAEFYDSNNHLTTAGARQYSQRLVQNLRAAGALNG